MSDPSLALQKAFVAALRGQTEAGPNVFDRVPPSNPKNDLLFPRIIIGTGTAFSTRVGGRSDGCYYAGTESTCFVDIWGGRNGEIGFPEVKRICGQVRDILDDAELDLTANGHRLEMLDYDTTAYERDGDGLTSRALMAFRATTQAL